MQMQLEQLVEREKNGRKAENNHFNFFFHLDPPCYRRRKPDQFGLGNWECYLTVPAPPLHMQPR
jgi:hypothetical protein